MISFEEEVIKMREFKFRAWYEPRSKMYYDVDCRYFGKGLIRNNKMVMAYVSWQDIDNPIALESDSTEVMEYTGLKDNNKKEIYEEDILIAYGGAKKQGTYEFQDIGRVKWIPGGFVLSTEDGDFNLSELNKYSKIEKIGNMYQNSEFLEKP